MEQFNLFNLLPDDDPLKEELKPKKATDWKWTMKDDYPSKKNGLKVFSCFACGGGSTMGYKLAGCEVLGCCEIDPKMNEVYVENHHPKYNYLMDIRDFNKLDNLPEELYNLDILDGSPPCSTFSMAGQREKGWGVEKKFREGQKLQTLDDLLFIFIETVEKLKPKVAIMENVEGLMLGNAWEYCKKIFEQFKTIGYQVRMELMKGENMGVPQTRHRVFFIATRLDFDLQKVNLVFNYEEIPYGEIRQGDGLKVSQDTKTYELLCEAKSNEYDLSEANKRLYGKSGWFQSALIDNDKVMPTIRTRMSDFFRRDTKERISVQDVISSQTFPQDFNFMPNTDNKVVYICGMSVPPIMIKRITTRLIESGIFDKELKKVI